MMDGQFELSLRAPRALNVTQLVRTVREALEANLGEYWVVGEISNARRAPSGHLYFTLKDARSAIAVVMFRSAAQRMRFRPADGMQVVVRGRVNLYEARGMLQFYAEEMEPRGLGALQLAFEQLKSRLGREGLFDPARKRELPFLPSRIGIVTALGGAGLRDIITVILARYPNLHLIIRPARVQGAGSAEEVAAAIEDLNADGRAEVMIVGRGGGSLEDLWAFNEETVARAIYRSRIPVVSAVGHEIDYTIADFVADARAPTPTAAAHLVIPAKAELRDLVDTSNATLQGALASALTGRRADIAALRARLREPRALLRQARMRADEAAARLTVALDRRMAAARAAASSLAARLKAPAAHARAIRLALDRLTLHLGRAAAIARGERLRARLGAAATRLTYAAAHAAVARRRGEVAAAAVRLRIAFDRVAERRRGELAERAARLDALSPLRVLERGYAVVIAARDLRLVVDAASVEVNDELLIRLGRGRLRARTTARET